MATRRREGEKPLFDDNHGVDPETPGMADRPPIAVDGSLLVDEERELVASVLRKDRKAAATFVAAHIDAVYAYASGRLAPRADLVDDVVQDVFLAALKGLPAFQGQSSLRTWLIGIARHKVEDVYRQRLRLPKALDDVDSVDEESLPETPPLDERIDTARARARARRLLAQLPERYGILLLWRYWEERSTREIAAAIGASEKSVERMLARARERFKQLWVKE
jgi:RNA polymerase sigma-70 factor (ECF subfamily)